MRKGIPILLACLLLNTFILIAGGPWTPNKGKGLVILNATPLVYTTITTEHNEHLNTNRSMLEFGTQIYVEHGITDELAVIGNIPIRYIRSGDKLREGEFDDTLDAGDIIGFGNISAGLKYQFYEGKLVVAGSFRIDANSAAHKEELGLQTGLKTWGFYPGIHLGKSITDRMYIQLEGNVGLRLFDYSHEYNLFLEYGGKMKKPIWIALLLQWKGSFKNGSVFQDNYVQTGLYNNNQEFIAYTVKFSWESPKQVGVNWSVGGGAWTAYTARAPAITLGVFYKW